MERRSPAGSLSFGPGKWKIMDVRRRKVYGSLKRGRVPILGDFYSGLESMQCWGGGLEFLIWLGAAVQISVIVTCVLFLAGRT